MKRRAFLAAAAATVTAKAQGPGPVRPAPPLQMVLNNGQVFDLSKQRGSVVVIEVLLTGCPACQSGARLLTAIQRDFAAKGVKVVGMAINEDAALGLPGFLAQTSAEFPIGIKNVQFAMDFLQHSTMKRFLMPRLIFIDKKGMIRAHYGADEDWMAPAVEDKNIRALLSRLVSEPGGAPAAKATSPKAAAKK